MSKKKKVGILTAGGDCPGLNAVIRAAVLHGIKSYDHEFVGFRDGWRGLVEGDIIRVMNLSSRATLMARVNADGTVTVAQR